MSSSTHDNVPSEAPPPYSPADAPITPKTRSNIPPLARRSMEDETRPLPAGWLRQYDSTSGHQFFVDTKADPPRSIWHHPEDDDQYIATLPAGEQERIGRLRKQVTDDDAAVESDNEPYAPATSRPQGKESKSKVDNEGSGGARGLATKLKDKMTNSTHEERQAERERRRREREEVERKMYEQHQAFRRAMAKAMETGEPQLLGKDQRGQEVWVEPPTGYGGYGGGALGPRGMAYSPYASGGMYGGGMYGRPDPRYMRPVDPYGRPYGRGYGGGMGLPIVGGLMGGALLGGLLF